jgi:hypothetical protein
LGFEVHGDDFFVADGSTQIVRTRDFTTYEPVHSGAVNASDVTVRRE